MKCAKHPRYKGATKPRSSCETCWVFYLGMSEACYNCGCEVMTDGVIKGLSYGPAIGQGIKP